MMTGRNKVTIRLLMLSLIVALLTGCQLMQPKENSPPPATQEALQAESLALQQYVQQELATLEVRQQAIQKQQVQETRRLRLLLEKHQQENALFQRQHTFQIEQLGNLLEPGFINSPITEVIQSDGKLMLGEYEWVLLHAQQLVLPARIDSGAQTSSLHAVNLQYFERDGKTWVRFETHYQPESNQTPAMLEKLEIEAPLVRKVNVTQAAGSEIRPVIALLMQLGSLTQNVEFTLTNRGNLTFPVLLGRRFFMDIAVIDVSKTYVQGKPEVVVVKPVAPVEIPVETQP